MQQDEVLNQLLESARKQKQEALAFSKILDEENKELDKELKKRGLSLPKKPHSVSRVIPDSRAQKDPQVEQYNQLRASYKQKQDEEPKELERRRHLPPPKNSHSII